MHFMSGILAEWEIMKPFARPGSVVVFDDVCLDWKKMPRHLFKQDDFCGHFLLNEAWKEAGSLNRPPRGAPNSGRKKSRMRPPSKISPR